MDKLPVDRTTSECWQLGTDQITVLTSSAQTHGHLFAVETRMPPGGGPPVMHRHDHSEVYYVTEGEFTFYVGGDSVTRHRAGPGDVVPLAGGTPHTIRNESDSDAVAFVVHTPGAAMEGFTRAAAVLGAPGRRPTMEQVLALAQEHGIEMLGPVPAEV
ncbi:cupin domain-containing protein [Nocardia sp. NPDC058658]|uniref:cupin domain-containing protein n=1 Tax=Nocardia sp. NPDC058658 TaxID=3346580 RepID=UPI0036625676